MRKVALLLLGVALGFMVGEHKKPTPQRKARERHRLAIERPRSALPLPWRGQGRGEGTKQ